MVRRFLQSKCLLSQVEVLRSPSGGILLRVGDRKVAQELAELQEEEQHEELAAQAISAMPWTEPPLYAEKDPFRRSSSKVAPLQLQDLRGEGDDESTEESPLLILTRRTNGSSVEPHEDDEDSTEESPLILGSRPKRRHEHGSGSSCSSPIAALVARAGDNFRWRGTSVDNSTSPTAS